MFYGNFAEGRGEKFKQALATIQEIFGRVYAQDMVVVMQKNVGFLQDPQFKEAFFNHCETDQERSLGWRLHTLTWAAEQCLHLEGDYVECGVWKAFCFSVITEFLKWENVDKEIYLYDTYEGIPDEWNSENRPNTMYEQQNAEDPEGQAIYKHVLKKMEKYGDKVHVVKGIVPDTFKEQCPEKIAFMHIDMNSAKSEIAALDALWERVVPNGIVVFDDYGWSGYAKQKIAEDKWFAERGHKVMELASGQGMVIKKS